MIWRMFRILGIWGVEFFMLGVAAAQGDADRVVNTRDTLVYKDGDRILGTVVQRTPELIVFRSPRFGELRVNAKDAVVIPAEKNPTPAPKPAVAVAPAPTPKAQAAAAAAEAEEERVTIWDRFSPGVLTARVRKVFGPWKGRFAFATEVVSDVAERNNHSFEGRVTRKWERDELQLSARYDYAETNDLPTADLLKASGSFRHEFTKAHFAHYRPTVEWNRASRRLNVPNDYVLLQQEIGVGFNLLNTPARKLRAGVAENLFDLWNTAPVPDHTSRGTPSAFEEIELKLPWQMGLTQRGVWYPAHENVHGWENRVELNKKLTETLSTSVRHEIRRNNPDGTAQDYTRLRLLFALDF